MKDLSKFFAITAVGLAVACNNAPTETVETTEAKEVAATPEETSVEYAVVTDGDEVMWEGFKTYADGAHQGTIQITEGHFVVENGEVTGGSFVIDMNSIQSTDLAENQEYHEKLVGHLKSEDFFLTSEYPTATFTITEVSRAENAEKGTTHNISGNLKMRGNEKNITFPATVEVNEGTVSLSAPEFVIDRTNWSVMYGSKNLGSLAQDKLIDNNIKLKVDLKAEKA